MTINPDVVRNWKTEPIRERYSNRRTMLYALGVGAGPDELNLVYESGLKALPTLAVTLAEEGFWMQDPRTGISWQHVLHGEQALEMHRPLPPSGEVVGQASVDALIDKGKERGAVLMLRRTLTDASSNQLIATMRSTALLRADGGFGGSAEGSPRPSPMPTREPDLSISLPTRLEQALIYRLSGDFNPIHADPVIAAEAGFERPILHGLCTYGVAARAVVKALCDGDPDRLTRLDVRFSAPVYPGETLITDIWHEARGAAVFRMRLAERPVTVVNNGVARYAVG